MKCVDTIARIRREFFVQGKTIKEIVRELHVSRNTVRKVVRSGAWFKLKLVKKGSCRVRGSAPAIPGQWSAYTTTRAYTVR